jgi:hypothetical protein
LSGEARLRERLWLLLVLGLPALPLSLRAGGGACLLLCLAGLLLVHDVVRDIAASDVAAWTVSLLFFATFLYWYVVVEPSLLHAASFSLAAAALAVWWRTRDRAGMAPAIVLGLLIGLATGLRGWNASLLLLPAPGLWARGQGRPKEAIRNVTAMLGAFGLAAVLPVVASFGRGLPTAAHPRGLDAFFSSRHGLLFWTPVLWAGFLGYVSLCRRERPLAAALLPPFLVLCAGNVWSGDDLEGAFSSPRFDSALPFLALGLATSLAWLRDTAWRKPGRVLAGGSALLVVWNFLLMEQYRRRLVPADDTVSFPRVTETSARLLSETVGTPLAWPANWLFAWRYGLRPDRYDHMAGKSLFEGRDSPAGVIDFGDERVDPALVADGWSGREPCGEAVCRRVVGRARLFAPLDVPRSLDVVVRAAGAGTLAIAVNGRAAGASPLAAGFRDVTVRVPAASWQSPLNAIVFEVVPGGEARIDKVVLERPRLETSGEGSE